MSITIHFHFYIPCFALAFYLECKLLLSTLLKYLFQQMVSFSCKTFLPEQNTITSNSDIVKVCIVNIETIFI
jgi:hypothetical protein